MKCKYCKTDIDDGVLVCPNCGAPAPVDKDYQEEWDEMMGYTRDEDEDFVTSSQILEEVPAQEIQSKTINSMQTSKLGICAFVCAVTTVLAPIGFVLGMIDLFMKNGKSKMMSIIAMGVAVFDVLFILYLGYMLQWF